MELTKEDFEKILEKKLDEQTIELKSYTKEQTEQLARMVKDGFDDILDHLDVRDRVQKLKKEMAAMKTALHLS